MLGHEHIGDGDHHIEALVVAAALLEGGRAQSHAELQEIEFRNGVALVNVSPSVDRLAAGWHWIWRR